VLVAGSSASTFDLKATLPSIAKPGGIFSVDRAGAPLPIGVALTSDGVLSASGAFAGATPGVVFVYVEPA
jgi:hypothetical protein